MRFRKVLSTGIAAMLSSSMLLVACSGNNGDVKPGNSPGTGSAAASKEPAKAAEKPDPFGKYDPPIEVTSVREMNSAWKFPSDQTMENNVWTKGYEQDLGMKVKYLWTSDQYEQKLNLTIASGQLPDVMAVNATQLQQLADAGQLADLTDVYQQYASPVTKEYLEKDGGASMRAATLNGKLLALPFTASGYDQAPLLWVRTDWLKKLNLPEPKTMQDVFAIAEAFTTQDPDGNQKNDTFGLGATKGLYGHMGTLEGFFNGYHVYPGKWVKDASGKLVYGGVQPEMKAALAKLNEMYKKGQIDSEFGVRDGNKLAESLTSGKLGMFFGEMWASLFPLQDGKNLNPEMDWKAYPLPSIDGKPAKPQIGLGTVEYYVVKKNFKNPEVVVKLMNYYLRQCLDPNTRETFSYKDGMEFYRFSIVKSSSVTSNIDAYLDVKGALETKDTSKMKVESNKVYYEAVDKFMNQGDISGWGYTRVFGPGGSQSLLHHYFTNNGFQRDEFFGAPTPSMGDKIPTLGKMEVEQFTKIIMGAAPIDSFDEFAANWNKLGGEQVTKEVNDWKAKQ
ncbi:extracellular solute-binding protein [Paenibacillus contaminans]|uniref:ABC transporter substrate-binding protein n=1 Tax=Paenibacillus contaminans TaxID=450362 RepID=A0A329M2M8_9BACL|nr:extracellular solute-binding protein [Paenibacillus contaminans]RAV14389.1 hypothetical protein DQG23_31330 [Paenibacillus contaminans]